MARLRRGKGINCRIARRTTLLNLSLYAPLNRKSAKPAKPSQSEFVDEVMAKAEAVVDRLAAEYPAHASRDITDLRHFAARMGSDQANRNAHFGEILRIAHDMRGQGVLFGYPLMTRCAASLCRATRLLSPHDPAIPIIVQTHIEALHVILESGLRGLEDRSALTIAAGLEFLVSARLRH